MTANIKLFLADDHPVFRAGLKGILTADEQVTIIGEAGDGESALRLIGELKPDIAILDLDMPKLSGIKVLEALRGGNVPVEVVFLTMHDDEDIFNRAMDAGAMAYLLKDSVAAEVISCVHSVAGGKPYITPAISSFLLNRTRRSPATNDVGHNLNSLTPAERGILSAIARNKTSKEIAEELFISIRTVDNHRSSICSKLGISGNNALLHFALEHKKKLI